jgi:ATP-dependent Lon protease
MVDKVSIDPYIDVQQRSALLEILEPNQTFLTFNNNCVNFYLAIRIKLKKKISQ